MHEGRWVSLLFLAFVLFMNIRWLRTCPFWSEHNRAHKNFINTSVERPNAADRSNEMTTWSNNSEISFGPLLKESWKDEGVVQNFLYLCPPKTGSGATRSVLRRFCESRNLSCVHQETCAGLTNGRGHCGVLSGTERWIEHSALTHGRILSCCPHLLNSSFHALAAHLHIQGPHELRFLARVFPPNPFRFTILRDPVEHFISYHAWMTARIASGFHRYLPALLVPFHSFFSPLAKATKCFRIRERRSSRLLSIFSMTTTLEFRS